MSRVCSSNPATITSAAPTIVRPTDTVTFVPSCFVSYIPLTAWPMRSVVRSRPRTSTRSR
jgi:hypothetical protein